MPFFVLLFFLRHVSKIWLSPVCETRPYSLLSVYNFSLCFSVFFKASRGQVDEMPIEITFTPLPPHDSLSEQPSTSYTPSNSDWLSMFQIPWERMPAALLHAASNKEKAPLGPRREFVRNVVTAMRELCPNPNLADCGEVAKQIFSKHSLTFGDFSEEGEQLGKGYSSLQRQLKTRVEHVNRDNVAHRIRQPKKKHSRTRTEQLHSQKS